jgi:hypothetical protein
MSISNKIPNPLDTLESSDTLELLESPGTLEPSESYT